MAFSIADVTIVVTPLEGPYKDRSLTAHVAEATLDLGDKPSMLKGAGAVVDIAFGTPEAKLSFTIDDGARETDLRAYCVTGRQYHRCRVTMSCRRPGEGSMVYRCEGKMSKGGGLKLGDDGVRGNGSEFSLTKVTRSRNGGRPEAVIEDVRGR